MKLRWKLLTGLGLATIIGGTYVYQNRVDIILKRVATQGKPEVGPTINIDWAQGPDTAAENRPPNIVFILADDLGINDISTFGGGLADGKVPTPHIDRLAREGAIFTQAYAGNATCAPSRAMLMTGRYPTRTGFEYTPTPPGMGRMVAMIANDMKSKAGSPIARTIYTKPEGDVPDFYGQGLPPEEITIAETLKANGYHTVHIGKWHLGYGDSAAHNQGFDESLHMDDMYYLPKEDSGVVNAELDFDPIDKFLWARGDFANSFNGGKPFRPGGYLTDYWTDESLKVIEANKNRPFFLYLAHWGVHTPLQATKADYEAVSEMVEDDEPHRLKVYGGMLRALDRSVGRVIEKLEEEGLAENTIIVFSSDNGGAGYIGIPGVNAPYRGWKLSMFEGGIKAPMFVKWPARIEAGTQIDTPVAHIDVMPTLTAAAGAKLPDVSIDGRNMLTLISDSEAFNREDDALYWQSGYLQVVRAGDWKLQHEGRRDKHWLYNLATDPTEQNNLAETEPEKLAELKALLVKHQAGRTPSLYPYSLENPVQIDKTLADEAAEDDVVAWWPN
ncbi:MAG: sulfatase [Maricaulaceae bacterium]